MKVVQFLCNKKSDGILIMSNRVIGFMHPLKINILKINYSKCTKDIKQKIDLIRSSSYKCCLSGVVWGAVSSLRDPLLGPSWPTNRSPKPLPGDAYIIISIILLERNICRAPLGRSPRIKLSGNCRLWIKIQQTGTRHRVGELVSTDPCRGRKHEGVRCHDSKLLQSLPDPYMANSWLKRR